MSDLIDRQTAINLLAWFAQHDHLGITPEQIIRWLPSAQPNLQPNLQQTCNLATDCISRKAAIEAVEDVDWYHVNKDGQLTHGANSEEDEPLYKAEDVYKVLNDMPSVPQNLQPTCNQLATDTIDRQAAIDAILREYNADDSDFPTDYQQGLSAAKKIIEQLPSAQPEPAIPLQWIEAQIEWLKSLDNAFSTLTALQISAMVNKWKGEQDG